MPRPNPASALAQREMDLRPATKRALQMYATGAAKTIGEAARAVGMAPGSVYVAHASKTGRELMANMDEKIETRAVDVTKLIADLSEKAVNKMAHLMERGGSENIQLMAAKDLLDRNPVTSKTQKIQAEGLTMGAAEAQALAAALIEASGVRERTKESGKQNLLAIASADVVSVASATPSRPAQPATIVEGL